MLRLVWPMAVLAVSVSSAAALDLPARKPGLWELRMLMQGTPIPPMVMQHCIDAETDKLMQANVAGGGMGQLCSKQDMRREGAAIVIDSVCTVAGATVTTRAVITGNFDSAYTVKSSSTRQGGPELPGVPATMEITIEAKHTGPCKAGQQAGDMILPTGQKINIRDVPGMGAPRQ